MAKSIRFRNSYYLDSSSVVHNRQTISDYIDKLRVVYSITGTGGTYEYTFTADSLYLLVVMQNGNDNHCIVDIVYGTGVNRTRIKECQSGSATATYSNHKVTITTSYSTQITIVKLR